MNTATTTATVPMCAVVHFEMPYKDRERAERFYAAAFGWTHQFLGPQMGDYVLVNTAPPGARPPMPPEASLGSINGGLFPFKADWPMQHPSVVIGVDDIQGAMQRVRAAAARCWVSRWRFPAWASTSCSATPKATTTA